MKSSNLFFLLILFLLMSSGYSLTHVHATSLYVDQSEIINNASLSVSEELGGTRFLTGPNTGDPLEIAFAYIEQNKRSLGFSGSDLDDLAVADIYTSQHNSVTHIYLRQRIDGIEIEGANININVASDGSVISLGNNPDVSKDRTLRMNQSYCQQMVTKKLNKQQL